MFLLSRPIRKGWISIVIGMYWASHFSSLMKMFSPCSKPNKAKAWTSFVSVLRNKLDNSVECAEIQLGKSQRQELDLHIRADGLGHVKSLLCLKQWFLICHNSLISFQKNNRMTDFAKSFCLTKIESPYTHSDAVCIKAPKKFRGRQAAPEYN